MTREEIKAKLFSAIDEYNYEGVEITEETSFVDDLGFDSLDELECILYVEKFFDIEIPFGEAGNIKNVKEAIDILEKIV